MYLQIIRQLHDTFDNELQFQNFNSFLVKTSFNACAPKAPKQYANTPKMHVIIKFLFIINLLLNFKSIYLLHSFIQNYNIILL